MVKKIQCRVIASSALNNRNVSSEEIFTEVNPIVNNLPKSLASEMLTYTNRSGTVKVRHDGSQPGKLLDLFL